MVRRCVNEYMSQIAIQWIEYGETATMTAVLAQRGELEGGPPRRWWREAEGCRGSPTACPPPSLPRVARSAAPRAPWLGSSASCVPHQRTPVACGEERG